MSIAYRFYVAYVAVASLGIFWWQPVTETITAYDLARLAALLGLPYVLLQPVLAARLPWLDRIVSLDKIMRWHRLTGIIGLSLILTHVSLLLAYYAQFGFDVALSFITPGWKWETLGSLSLAILVLTVVLAMLRKRLHLPYHWWKRLHVIVYVAVFGGALHALMLGSDLAASSGLRWYMISLMVISGLAISYRRLAVPLLAWSRPYQVTLARDLVPGVRQFILEPQRGNKFNHQPGQFAFIKFKADAVTSEWHPFTISSAPSEPNLTFSIKASGDWTSQLQTVLPGDMVYVEGPFGQFTYDTSNRPLVFIAGGIGITPLRSMITELTTHPGNRPITLLYANKRESDISFRDEFEVLAKNHSQRFQVVHVLSRAEATSWSGETGHVTAALINKYVKNPIAADYYICGPVPMMQTVIHELRSLGVPRQQIHFELFSLV